MRLGLGDSESHPENGMTEADMVACEKVANDLNEVIIFRSTGPWAKRWLSQVPPFPSKNFHVKGKSSNWGPQAGFVPYLGKYSKVGNNPEKAADGTRANDKGLEHSQFAVCSQLKLTAQQIDTQLTQVAEGRLAIQERIVLPDGSMILRANRFGDRKMFTFFAKKTSGANYPISVFREDSLLGNPHFIQKHDPQGNNADPLLIMGSAEAGADGRAMTGDYDLLAVCPPIRDRFSQIGHDKFSSHIFTKDAIKLQGSKGNTVAAGLGYQAGQNMDKVLDVRLHTGSDHRKSHGMEIYSKEAKTKFDEHEDIGNVTPRILRCINMLNIEMKAVGDNGWARRVHHNAESHRFIDFGALKRTEMDAGDGFPFAAFLPAGLVRGRMRGYATIVTLENMAEFVKFCEAMHEAEYWVPTNWTWKMKNTIADRIQMFNNRGGVRPTPNRFA